jgi:hypothetical protein
LPVQLDPIASELAEAMRSQAATAEILRAINHSSSDLPSLLDRLLAAAAQLGGADIGTIRHRIGEDYVLAATYGCTPEWKADFARYSTTPDRGSVYGRTMIDGSTVHIPDVLADREFTRHAAQQ